MKSQILIPNHGGLASLARNPTRPGPRVPLPGFRNRVDLSFGMDIMTPMIRKAVSLEDAKARLPELVVRAAYGNEEVLITRRGKPGRFSLSWAMGFAFPVECPTCEGGRIIRMSIGPIPCDSGSDRKTVPWVKALVLRIRMRAL